MSIPKAKAELERIFAELRMNYCTLTCAAIAIEKTDEAETNNTICGATGVLTEQLARLDRLTNEIDAVLVELAQSDRKVRRIRIAAANVVDLRQHHA